MKFIVKIGTHIEGDRTYTKGDVVESDRNLNELFPQKFLVPTIDQTPVEAKKPSEPKFGKDATADFPEADENGLKVFQKGKNFTVVEADEATKQLHPKKLKADEVNSFITTYLDEEE